MARCWCSTIATSTRRSTCSSPTSSAMPAVCVAPTRFHVQEGIYERFAKGFAERAAALKIGDGLSSETQMGPMANPRRPEAIGAMIEDAVKNGARMLTGGEAKGGEASSSRPPSLPMSRWRRRR